MPGSSDNVSFVAYIDEAGDHGSDFAKCDSFLTMGAAIVPAEVIGGASRKYFDEARKIREKDGPFRKFSSSSDRDNFVLTALLPEYPFVVTQVAFYKPALKDAWMRKRFDREYNYLAKFLIERISWFTAAAKARHGNGKCRLVFSKNDRLDYQSMEDYLAYLRRKGEQAKSYANWDSVDPAVIAQKHSNETETHLADIAASALHKAIERKLHGMTDDRYQRNLAKSLYRNSKGLTGLKLYPQDAISALIDKGHLDFLKLI